MPIFSLLTSDNSFSFSPTISRLLILIDPFDAVSSPEASMIIEVFPEPLGPTMETTSSIPIEKLIPFKTLTVSALVPYFNETLLNCMAALISKSNIKFSA